ncbi:class I SAM-dependent methyltransferase [Phenylobacterium sp.]|uniref:class I SAM-dependent methyltransferase n=1 Tax=Phenylobacterium sp. TaxID=1871053 RepID=UPI002EDA4694
MVEGALGAFEGLIACPACGGALKALACPACAATYADDDGVLRLRAPADARTETVRAFYEAAPFPGYPPRDSLAWLRARAERSAFARLLDQAIPGDARIVEVGCGTGQMSLYLARADRVVVGADLTLASLRLAEAARRRFGLQGVRFVESDLNRPGLRAGAFDVVYCSGVLHHTPDPRAAFARVARLARPGGMIVIGLYNAVARLPLRARRLVARASGYRWIPFDPVLADRAAEPARREAWLRDQYRHPEEHRHTVGEVLRWFRDEDVEFVRAYPSAQLRDEAPDDLFAAQPDAWPPERWLAQLGWIGSLGHEGGLFIMVGRRSA